MKISEAFEKYWETNIRDPDVILGHICEGVLKVVDGGITEDQLESLFSPAPVKIETGEFKPVTAVLEKSLDQKVNEIMADLVKNVNRFSNPAGVLTESLKYLQFLMANIDEIDLSGYHVRPCLDAADKFYDTDMYVESSKLREAVVIAYNKKKQNLTQARINGYKIQKIEKALAYTYSYLANDYHGMAEKAGGNREFRERSFERAHNSINNSISLFERFGPDIISKVDKCFRLGYSYAHLGHLHRKLRRFGAAKDAFKQSLSYLRQIPEPRDKTKKKISQVEDSLKRLKDFKKGPNFKKRDHRR